MKLFLIGMGFLISGPTFADNHWRGIESNPVRFVEGCGLVTQGNRKNFKDVDAISVREVWYPMTTYSKNDQGNTLVFKRTNTEEGVVFEETLVTGVKARIVLNENGSPAEIDFDLHGENVQCLNLSL